MDQLTPRQRNVVAALAADRGASFAPVQVQKLFFLLDRNIPGDLGGQQFAFEPYDYGPFDAAVYSELEALARNGLVVIEAAPGADRRRYALTPEGYEIGRAVFAAMPAGAQDYLTRVSTWVRSLSFAELVGSIYKQYPDMKVNSVFRG